MKENGKEIIILRLSIAKNDTPIKSTLEAILVKYRITKAKYHGGDLEGMTIHILFQNTKAIFNECSIVIIENCHVKEEIYLINDNLVLQLVETKHI